MAIGHIWAIANPELRGHLHRGSEARAAAFYAAYKAVAAAFGKVAERVRRAREARQTYHALAGLSDRTLKDIGISRSEILDVALGVHELPSDSHPTLAELRGVRSDVAAEVIPLAADPAPRQDNELRPAA